VGALLNNKTDLSVRIRK